MKKRVLALLVVGFLILVAFAYNFELTGKATERGEYISRQVIYSKGIWTVSLKGNVESYVLGISEKIPENMTVIKVSSQGVIKSQNIEWLFAPSKKVSVSYSLKNLSSMNQVNFLGKWYSLEEEGNVSGINIWNKKSTS